jgi:CRP-like cAMP-binding protein
MDKKAAIDFAKSHGWLTTTPEEFQAKVAARADLIRLEAKQPLYAAGDSSGGLFGLIEGRLDMHLTTLGNTDTLAFVVSPGMWIGDIAAVTGAQRVMSIIACTPCYILRLPRSEMLRIVEQSPAAWFHIAEMLAQNFARAIEMIELLRCPDPTRRIAALLCNLVGNRAPAPIRISQIEMAEMAHLGRTNVQSALLDLAQKGLVKRGYASVEIIDIVALKHFIQSPYED